MTAIYITDNGNIQVGEDIYPTGDLVADFDVNSSRLILHSSSKKNVAFQASYTDLSNKDGIPFENFDQFKIYIDKILSTSIFSKQTETDSFVVVNSPNDKSVNNMMLDELIEIKKLLKKIYA